jgi:hypothetical protein
MAIKFTPYKPKKNPLHCLLVGVSGSGKTTACASFLREPTMLLYVSKAEPHSPIYMASGVSLFQEASAENLFAVSVDVVQEMDKEVLPFADKLEVGSPLNPDQTWTKIAMYLEAASSIGIKAVVIDSLSGLFTTIRGTTTFANLCKTEKGTHNNFKEAESYLIMHEALNASLIARRDEGIASVCILGAKNIGVGSDSQAIGPDLPMYSVAEKLPFRYSDVLIITTRAAEGAEELRSILDFGVTIDRAGKGATGKVEKFISMSPRLSFAPPTVKISFLVPDLYYLREQVDTLEV